MACAKCSFYRPKDSTKTQILESKTNLLRLRQDIPLAEAEHAARWKNRKGSRPPNPKKPR